MLNDAVYLVGAARTPIGALLGSLSQLPAPKLGAAAMRAALERAGLVADLVGEVFMGNVLSTGIGQAPARQAAIFAGVPNTVPCTTVSKVCGSGLQAVILAAKSVLSGDVEVALAGGMESMSNVPYYLPDARRGYRMGDGKVVDGLIFDGLWDAYQDRHMGKLAEQCARQYGLDRRAQDAFAAESYRRAWSAIESGAFAAEIIPVAVPRRKGDPVLVKDDEEPGRSDPSQFGKLRPAFERDGTITAANASSISDGAAAVVLASEAAVKRHGLQPLAKILGWSSVAQAPEWFTTAPAKAIELNLHRIELSAKDIDLWEINEAFSCVTMACSRLVGIEPDRVNVRGGAVALGHPIGASGARILVTLIHALRDFQKRRGLATLCIGGGEAVAMVVERV
jgi:acetyl-CoA C-acetyltransferase